MKKFAEKITKMSKKTAKILIVFGLLSNLISIVIGLELSRINWALSIIIAGIILFAGMVMLTLGGGALTGTLRKADERETDILKGADSRAWQFMDISMMVWIFVGLLNFDIKLLERYSVGESLFIVSPIIIYIIAKFINNYSLRKIIVSEKEKQ